MQKDITYIYSLSHPITQNVAYIGKTDNINRRYKEHCKNTKNLNMYNWIKKLHDESLQPVMSIVETCSQINWEEREKHWIAYYGLENLINVQEGGVCHILNFVKKKKLQKDKSSKMLYKNNNLENLEISDVKKRNEFQDYLGEYYSYRKKRLYYAPKLTNPLGKFAKEMFSLLEKNDIVKIQEKARELQEWKGKNN